MMNRCKITVAKLTMIAVLALLAGGGGVFFRICRGTDAPPAGIVAAQPTQRLGIHEYAGAQVTPTPQPSAPGIAIPGWTGIRIEAGRSTVEVPFYNPEDNEGWYFLTFQVKLSETGEVLFQTGLVPPGQYCNLVKVDHMLEAGSYEATLFIQPYCMDEELTPTNNLEMPLKITVY